MQNYTIHCTPEQTKKALELGAPIEILSNYTEFRGFPFIKCQDGNERPYVPPTTEQMIGWLEEQEDIKEIFVTLQYVTWCYAIILSNGSVIECKDSYDSRKEATRVAIDAALEYLVDNDLIK